MTDYTNFAEQILALKDADLKMRDQLIRKGRLGDGYDPEMEQLHCRNAASMDEIISAIGYPTIDLVGQEASEAAWLIVQHSIGNPGFMRKCALLMERDVRAGKVDPANLAYLLDRISVLEGRPQQYGTQFDWDENGELSPEPVDDRTQVDQRRKALGLNTLEEQTEVIRRRAAAENHQCPPDLEERKREMNDWRSRVGWIL